MAEPSTRIPAHEVEPVAISDGHALANGGTLPGSGPTPTPAAASLPGGRAYADASGSAPRLREEGAEATNPALTELAAVVTDGGAPADGGSPKGADLTSAADPPPASASLWHATACFTTSPFLLYHLTSDFLSNCAPVVLCRFGDADDAPIRPGVAVSSAPPNVGG